MLLITQLILKLVSVATSYLYSLRDSIYPIAVGQSDSIPETLVASMPFHVPIYKLLPLCLAVRLKTKPKIN